MMYLGCIVNEGKGGFFIFKDFLESLAGRGNHATGFDGLEDVGVLLFDGIVPNSVLALVAVALQSHLFPNAAK